MREWILYRKSFRFYTEARRKRLLREDVLSTDN